MFKIFRPVLVLLFCASAATVPPALAPKHKSAAEARLKQDYGQLPLVFEPNHEQADRQVKWLARAPGYTLFLTETEAVMALRQKQGMPADAVRMRLAGSRPWRMSEGLEPTGGISNYFLGNKPDKWRTGIPHYRKVQFTSVYAGIDLVFYGNPQHLEYDLVVQPGADPRQIRLAYYGVRRVEPDPDGDLLLTTRAGLELRQLRPRVYQQIGGRQVEVAGVYEILDRRQVGIKVASYDARRPLRIDPVLVYSTYLGGSGGDSGSRVAVDATGSAYILGSTTSIDFPTQSPYQTRRADVDLFVSKLAPGGNALIYSTYLGGAAWDMTGAIAVDGAGYAYVTGATRSTDFPTQAAYQASHRGGRWEVFVTKLSPAGNSLAYSTYIGGNGDDEASGIAVDAAGSAYVAGYTDSTDYPTQSPYQATRRGRGDVFVTKLGPAGNTLTYSTYVGGSDLEWGNAMALDAGGAVYVTGFTVSTDFPTVSPYQASYRGQQDAFVFKLSPAGDALVYSTYLGGSDREGGSGIAVDAGGSAYVAGYTFSCDFPTQSAYAATYGGGASDAFLTKLSPSGITLAYSTYLGGSDGDWGTSVTVDGTGSAYVVGNTASLNFPTQSPYQASYRGQTDAFVVKFSPAGNTLAFSTYLGGALPDAPYGIALDSAGAAYVIGQTMSTDFPTQSPYQSTNRGDWEAFVTKLEIPPAPAGAPVISEVANAWSGQPLIADAAWIHIKGTNLAPITRMWRDSDIVNGKLPSALEGVRVKINDRDAYVYYISPTQINVQVPSDSVTGPAAVQVTHAGGTSATFTVNKQVTAPAIFVWQPGTAVEGDKYAGAVTSEGQQVVYIGKPGLLQPVGIPTRPARPSETVLLFVTGCGPTTPSFPAGLVVTPPVPTLSSPVNVKIGGSPAAVAGNTGYLIFAGECQFNVTIPPSAPDGDLLVEIDIGGIKAQGNIFITVQR